jgi:hypothetical protein
MSGNALQRGVHDRTPGLRQQLRRGPRVTGARAGWRVGYDRDALSRGTLDFSAPMV